MGEDLCGIEHEGWTGCPLGSLTCKLTEGVQIQNPDDQNKEEAVPWTDVVPNIENGSPAVPAAANKAGKDAPVVDIAYVVVPCCRRRTCVFEIGLRTRAYPRCGHCVCARVRCVGGLFVPAVGVVRARLESDCARVPVCVRIAPLAEIALHHPFLWPFASCGELVCSFPSLPPGPFCPARFQFARAHCFR